MNFRSNGVRLNGDSVKLCFGQMVFRFNGLSVKWPFGQMVFGQTVYGQMVFRSNSVRSKKFGKITFRLSDPEPSFHTKFEV
jgi:hypothetical protein